MFFTIALVYKTYPEEIFSRNLLMNQDLPVSTMASLNIIVLDIPSFSDLIISELSMQNEVTQIEMVLGSPKATLADCSVESVTKSQSFMPES